MFKTVILLSFLTGLFMFVGFLLAGPMGIIIALIIALIMNFSSYWYSDKAVLSFYKAIDLSKIDINSLSDKVSANDLLNYIETTQRLATKAGLPIPKITIIDQKQPNAFATGRNPHHAAISVSTGLINMLDQDEIAGVVAHELSHIKNHDTLNMTIAASIAGAISMLASFAMFFGGNRHRNSNFIISLLLMIGAPIVASIIQFTISRTREYIADRDGALLCEDPNALARALAKLDKYAKQIKNPRAMENPATAHLFIISPLSSKKTDSLFSTHPHTENRIKALNELAIKIGKHLKDEHPKSGHQNGGHNKNQSENSYSFIPKVKRDY